METWCDTSITFYIDNEIYLPELECFYNALLKQYFNCNFNVSNIIDPNPNWIGYIGNVFGIPENKLDEANLPDGVNSLRGYIQSTTKIDKIPLGNNQNLWYFSISTEDNYTPKINMWLYIIKNNIPNVKIAFSSSESNSRLYVKYDPTGIFYNNNNFILDINKTVNSLGELQSTALVKPNHPNSIFLTWDEDEIGYIYDDDVLVDRCNPYGYHIESMCDIPFRKESELVSYYNMYFGNANTINDIKHEKGYTVYEYEDFSSDDNYSRHFD